jgi:hypothetical protein
MKHLEGSIKEIQHGLQRAERQVEADARARIRALRRDASARLAALRSRHREVARVLDRVTSAAEGSWAKVKESADVVLAEAVDTATAIVKRMKKALPR